jgi:hypothetical protein
LRCSCRGAKSKTPGKCWTQKNRLRSLDAETKYVANADPFLPSNESKQNQRLKISSYELNGAISQQNGNAIDNRIAPPAALAPYGRFFKLQGLMADWTDDAAQILFRQQLRAHGSILADLVNS